MTDILLIEDNQDYRESLLEILQLENYQTVAAANGFLGWQMLQEHSPNLIISDVEMPVMNGLELLSMVKADPVLALIPFLILTGNTDSQMQENLHAFGAEALLGKPIAIEELLSVVAYFLKQNFPSI
jgi:CheY-like chemotaxis protein